MAARAIAVTGGIASGKSATTRCFEARGVEVIDADLVSRELVEPGQPALAEIVTRFGSAVLDADGRLDRRRLRGIVFADPRARHALEAILHPRVRSTLRERASRARGHYVLLAIPLLVESGAYPWVDRVLLLDVPRALQLARVMQRDAIDAAAAEALLDAQATRAQRLSHATDVIVNDAGLDALDAAAARLHARWSGAAAAADQAERPAAG